MRPCLVPQVVLQLLVIGVEQVQDFDYLSPPDPDALLRALQTLLALGCVAAQVRGPTLYTTHATVTALARLPHQ